MNIRIRHGAIHFIIFIDDFTRFSYIYKITHKFEALDYLMRFMNFVENQLGKKIRALNTNCGFEYLSDQFIEFVRKNELVIS